MPCMRGGGRRLGWGEGIKTIMRISIGHIGIETATFDMFLNPNSTRH